MILNKIENLEIACKPVGWLAERYCEWVTQKVEVKTAKDAIPQAAMVIRSDTGVPQRVIALANSLTTSRVGLTLSQQSSLVQVAELPNESAQLNFWFDGFRVGVLVNSEALKTCEVYDDGSA